MVSISPGGRTERGTAGPRFVRWRCGRSRGILLGRNLRPARKLPGKLVARTGSSSRRSPLSIAGVRPDLAGIEMRRPWIVSGEPGSVTPFDTIVRKYDPCNTRRLRSGVQHGPRRQRDERRWFDHGADLRLSIRPECRIARLGVRPRSSSSSSLVWRPDDPGSLAENPGRCRYREASATARCSATSPRRKAAPASWMPARIGELPGSRGLRQLIMPPPLPPGSPGSAAGAPPDLA
jgi:hypothetical protein